MEGPTEAPDLPVERGEIDDEIDLDTGMRIAVESIATVTISAETPGEVSGPAVAVTVSAHNAGSGVHNVDSAVVNLLTESGELAIPTWAGPADPLRGDVEPGETVVGTYVFMFDAEQGRTVIVSVNYSAGQPVAEFEGRIG